MGEKVFEMDRCQILTEILIRVNRKLCLCLHLNVRPSKKWVLRSTLHSYQWRSCRSLLLEGYKLRTLISKLTMNSRSTVPPCRWPWRTLVRGCWGAGGNQGVGETRPPAHHAIGSHSTWCGSSGSTWTQ